MALKQRGRSIIFSSPPNRLVFSYRAFIFGEKGEIMKVNKNDLIGRKVFVYYNLHKHTWSIKCWETKLVITHTDRVILSNCQYKVSQAGRSRVNSEQRKNVHAGILGDVVGFYPIDDLEDFAEITYNPYKYKTFVLKGSELPVYRSEGIVYMDNKRVFERSMIATLKVVA